MMKHISSLCIRSDEICSMRILSRDNIKDNLSSSFYLKKNTALMAAGAIGSGRPGFYKVHPPASAPEELAETSGAKWMNEGPLYV